MLAITVPAILLSAISLAKLGPLSTPTFTFLKERLSSIILLIVLKGLCLIPLVHEITAILESINGAILFTIVSNIKLGVAIKINLALETTSLRSSDAVILFESWSSG